MVGIKDICKGLVVFNDRLGLLIVDGMLDNGKVSCNKGNVKCFLSDIDRVNMDFLKSRRVTQTHLNKYNAHI